MYSEICFFVKIVQAGKITTAASTLGIAQSTISRKISSLEKKLNHALIRRGYGEISLTDYGMKLYSSFKGIEDEIEKQMKKISLCNAGL